MAKIIGNENKVHMEDGTTIEYDLLVVNVGSKTKSANTVPGVNEHSLMTRPINNLIATLEAKEKYLVENKIVPSLVVCGSGAAGTELAFGYKKRWSRLFNQEIKVSVVSSHETCLHGQPPATISEAHRKLKEHKIEVIPNEVVAKIEEDCVIFKSGARKECNVAVWATGADP